VVSAIPARASRRNDGRRSTPEGLCAALDTVESVKRYFITPACVPWKLRFIA
jgi:hypothetical protein